jgi:hypothetical protein
MSYKIKRVIIALLTGVVLLAAYGFYAFGKVNSGAATLDDTKFWATTILLVIGIGIVAMIVIQIIFHILLSIGVAICEQVKTGTCDDKKVEKAIELEMVQDEMDNLIELKATKIGYAVVGIGFVAALVSLVLEWPLAVMLNILFGSFVIGAMIEAFVQIHYYKKGI